MQATEPLAAVLAVRIMVTLAVGRFVQIVLRGLKAHEIGDMAWLLACVLCIGVGLQLAKEVIRAAVSFFEPIFTFVSWFTKDPDGTKRSWWEWLNTFPKGGP